MKHVLTLAAGAELATGLALLVAPSVVGWLLVGGEISGSTVEIARIAGIALIALGVACWPGATAVCGMLIYSGLATLYLGWLGVQGEWGGPLLWPAVGLHAILTGLLGRRWSQSQKAAASN